jgi:hypothetical protein
MVQTINNHRMNVPGGPVHHWLCLYQDPPVLLATYDDAGSVHIKVRVCPKCGLRRHRP